MKNFLVVHTHSSPNNRKAILDSLLGFESLDGISFQQSKPSEVHEVLKEYLQKSAQAGHPWVINMDELGPHYKGALPDTHDPDHDTIRQDVLWGSLMAGAGGLEWYFGYQAPENDLDCEDWRSRDKLWDQTSHALNFFQTHIPFDQMDSRDELTSAGNFCFAKEGQVYVVYQSQGNTSTLNLEGQSGDFSVQWFDPRNGGELQVGSVARVTGGDLATLGNPPNSPEKDWVLLVRK